MKKDCILSMMLSAAFAVSAMLTALPGNVLSRGPENAVIAQAADGDEPSLQELQDAFLAVYPEPELYLADSLGRGMIDPNTLRPDPDFPDVYDEGMDHPFIYDTLAQCVIDPNDGYGALLDVSAGLWTFWQRFSSLDFTINSEVELYEVLIMDFLTYQMEQSSYKSDFIKKTAKYGWKIQNSLLKNCVNLDEQTLINLVESTEPLTDEQKQYFNTVSHDLGILQTMQEYTSLLNELEGLAQTGKKAYENYMKALAIKEADDERKAFLYAMKSYVTDNPAFCTAIDNVIETLEATKASLIFDIPLEEFCKYAVKEGWSAFTKLNPLFAPLKLYGTGLDVLFNNDDQAANYYKLVLMHELEQYVKQSVQSLHIDYLRDQTQANASAFVGGYRSYLMFQAYASNWCRGYVSDAVYEGLANKLCNLVSNEADATYAFYQNEINQDMALCSELLSYLEQWTDWYYNFLDASYSGIDDSGSGSTDPDDPGNGSGTGGGNQAETDEPKHYDGGFDYGKLHYYTDSETTCYVRGFANGVNGRKESSVSIPGTVYLITETETKPYRVTGIYSRAFRDYTNLTSVSICSSIRTIPSELFKGCTNLRTVTSNAVSIGDGAFAGCSRLTSITANSPSIGFGAFSGCSSLTYAPFISNISSIPSRAYSGIGITSMTPPANISSIGSEAFSGCANLKSVTIPSTVVSVGDRAFSDCVNLKSFTIQSPDTACGSQILVGCTSIQSISVAKLSNHIGYFFHAGRYDSAQTYGCYRVSSGTGRDSYGYGIYCDIPYSLTHVSITGGNSVNSEVFNDCSSLTSISLPDSITSIGWGAFAGCTGLTSTEFLPDTVTSIGEYAFRGCTGLKTLALPSSLYSIGDYVFDSCSGLTALNLPASLQYIGTGAFSGCTGFTSVTIPSTVVSVGDRAFSDCVNLKSFTIQSTDTDYRSWILENCTSIQSVTLPKSDRRIAGLFKLVTSSTPADVAAGCYRIDAGTTSTGTHIYYDVPYSLKHVTITGGESIYSDAFSDLTTLTDVTLADSITSIGRDAFTGCTGLSELTIRNRSCSFGSGSVPAEIAICGWLGSTAQAYAEQNGNTFIPLDAPSISTQPNGIRAAIGTTAKFTVTAVGADLSYQWQYNSGSGWKNSNGTGAKTNTLSIGVTAARNGWKYRCILTDRWRQKTISTPATLKVKTAITRQPKSLSAPLGEAANFIVTATGVGLTYQWQYNKGEGWKTSNATGSKTNALTINTAAGYNGYQYRCVITDANGTKTISSAAKLIVKTTITAQPNGVNTAVGTTAKFTVTATGVGLKYQWQYNSGDGWKNSGASGATTATLSINAKTTYNGWKYRCVITDANGATATSSIATLKIRTSITTQPADTSAAINEAANFTVKATGMGLTYQWQYNAGDGWKNSGASGNKTAELTIYGKTAYNGWQFRCVVTDEIGTKVISSAAVFKVKTNITAQPASIETASGTAANFTVKATGLDLTYQWQYNNGTGWKNSNGTGATTATLTINAKSTYNNWQYRCVITDGNGAKAYSDAASLTVK